MTDLPSRLAGAAVEGLYVHVPVCRRRCGYCDFFSTVLDERAAGPLVDALIDELRFWAGRLDLSGVRTVFVGGGTPTALPADQLERLIEAIASQLRIADCGLRNDEGGRQPLNPKSEIRNPKFPDPPFEFTIEANPTTVDPPLARMLRRGGVNRISLGAQSFHPADLAVLGRAHGVAAIGESVRVVRAAGFDNVSLDLIYGIPSRGSPKAKRRPGGALSLETWRASLAAAVELGVEHLSCYGLTIEPGTVLAEDVRRGRLRPVRDELAVAMYKAAMADLSAAGFEHYEISNWARPGWACRHNLLYWHNRPWLGVGPSAASFVAGYRFKVAADLDRYVAFDRSAGPPLEQIERLAGRAAAGEAAVLALRLREGLDVRDFAVRYGLDPLAVWGDAIARHVEQGTLVGNRGRLRLAADALAVADSVLVDFV